MFGYRYGKEAYRKSIRDAERHGLPIPYTGKARWWRRGHYYRRNAYRHFFRAATAAQQDDRQYAQVGVRIRGKIVVPHNPWDDWPIMSRKNRNWKRFRKTRWKASWRARS